MLMLYDVNGFIAGMQSIVPKEDTSNDAHFNFKTSKWYINDTIDGKEVNYKWHYTVKSYKTWSLIKSLTIQFVVSSYYLDISCLILTTLYFAGIFDYSVLCRSLRNL